VLWLTWRQHRVQAAIAAAVVAFAVVGLVLLGFDARSTTHHLGLGSCVRAGGDCSRLTDQLHQHYHWLPPLVTLLIALPAIVGLFVTAPIVPREYDARTQRLVWTQSISRRNWMTTKLALLVGPLVLATLAIGLLATWALDPLQTAFGSRLGGWFEAQGVAPASYLVFALGLGACIGALTRRLIPAMATTVVAFVTTRFVLHSARSSWFQNRHLVVREPLGRVLGSLSHGGSDVPNQVRLDGASIVSTTVYDHAGRAHPNYTYDLLRQACPKLPIFQPGRGDITRAALTACRPRTNGLTIRIAFEYIPSSRFWTMQTVDALVFAALGTGLLVAAIVVVARSRPS
jgi:hypothetical protein